MKKGFEKLLSLRDKLNDTRLYDKSMAYNMARIEALELDNLVSISIAVALSANKRTESRGAHSREDYTERNDKDWIKHILVNSDDSIIYRSVNMTPSIVAPFQPIERKY